MAGRQPGRQASRSRRPRLPLRTTGDLAPPGDPGADERYAGASVCQPRLASWRRDAARLPGGSRSREDYRLPGPGRPLPDEDRRPAVIVSSVGSRSRTAACRPPETLPACASSSCLRAIRRLLSSTPCALRRLQCGRGTGRRRTRGPRRGWPRSPCLESLGVPSGRTLELEGRAVEPARWQTMRPSTVFDSMSARSRLYPAGDRPVQADNSFSTYGGSVTASHGVRLVRGSPRAGA